MMQMQARIVLDKTVRSGADKEKIQPTLLSDNDAEINVLSKLPTNQDRFLTKGYQKKDIITEEFVRTNWRNGVRST